MIDPRLLRTDSDAVAEALARRGHRLDLAALRGMEAERKELQSAVESLQARRNLAARDAGRARAEGRDMAAMQKQATALAAELDAKKAALAGVRERLQKLYDGLPQIPAPQVPDGLDESDNKVLRQWGEVARPDFEQRDHLQLGAPLGMDFDSASRMSGARFVVLRGALARLQRALAAFMLDLHTTRHGYEEVYAPWIVSADALYGTGQLPKFADELFAIDGGRYLIPTAEVPLTNLLAGQIHEGPLPLRLVCHSPCFRSEAGSHGKDTRGMLRQHQFDKVELMQFVRPEQAQEAHEQLCGHAERVLQMLELPYQVVALCAGDLGFSARLTWDLEVWMPGQGKYREISSCSDFGDFQCRRLGARYRARGGKPQLLHSINGSGLALGRTLIALLENGQRADGSIAIPKALRPHLGGAKVLEPAAEQGGQGGR